MISSSTLGHFLINNGINHCATALTRQAQDLWSQTSTHPFLSSPPIWAVAMCPPHPSPSLPAHITPPFLIRALSTTQLPDPSLVSAHSELSPAVKRTESAPLSRAVMSKLLLRRSKAFHNLIPTSLLTSGSSLIIHLVLLSH